jgi:hypothetical protein
MNALYKDRWIECTAEEALILGTGHGILPFITPDDPDAVVA